ncbi:hypothetical protein [Actinomadura madurae]|uniref:Uncharacterized protein n=1 Tax=Actinomadura madurae TaxID=1993 RepID=A0A1I5L1G8_9ACTN|nr:hypothetical protein [Actinomadura madurae]SFO91115.1 hypothetical protein SAMN04489713_110213 [Actinomadura madurae]SPT49365.1 Uncharacterised protein [Actinomadura madurae]
MAGPPAPDAPANHPAGWSIWPSCQDGRGRWWATRDRLLTESEIRDGLVHTLCAGTEAQLRHQLNMAHWAQQTADLRAEFPVRRFHHHTPDAIDLDWEAKRPPYRFPPAGGYAWIRAESAPVLRQFLGGAAQAKARLAAEEAIR